MGMLLRRHRKTEPVVEDPATVEEQTEPVVEKTRRKTTKKVAEQDAE